MKKFSKKLLSIFLSILMIVSVLPIEAVPAQAAEYEKAYFPMEYLNVSNGYGTPNCTYNHTQKYCVDVCGKDGGKDVVYAPFSGTIKKLKTSVGTCVLESDEPVIWANGTVDYMHVLYYHCNNLSEFGLYSGKHINQGEAYYREGTQGNATGSHVHLETGRGKYPGGEVETKPGSNIWRLKNQVKPNEVLFVSADTTILRTGSLTWKKDSGHFIKKKAAYSYNPNAALEFAKKHCATDIAAGIKAGSTLTQSKVCTQGGNSGWQCAQFVSECLKAGGFTKVYDATAYTFGRKLQKYGTKIKCNTPNGNAIYAKDFESKLTPGDIIVWEHGPHGSENAEKAGCTGHISLYAGTSSNGRILVYAHNGRKVNEVSTMSSYAIDKYAIHLDPNGAPTVKNTTIDTKTVTNDNAKIGFTVSPNQSFDKWGFICKETKATIDDHSAYQYHVDTKAKSCNIKDYKKLTPGTKYYYRIYIRIGNTWYWSPVGTFTTTKLLPGKPAITANADSKDIGISGTPTVSWKAVSNVESYTAKLFDINGKVIETKTNIGKNATSFTFSPIDKVGQYKAIIYAINTASPSGVASAALDITVHDDVNVKFVDAAPASFVDCPDDKKSEAGVVLDEKTIHYGTTAELATNPNHDGYTFDGWNGDSKRVTEDTTFTAQYSINEYEVKFVDENGNMIGSTQKVEYYSDAVAPKYDVSEQGYKFVEWDKSFEKIKENTTIKAVVDWYDHDYNISTSIKTAIRDTANQGYEVEYSIVNGADNITNGRAIIVLKSNNDEMLSSTESSAFSMKKGETRSFSVFVPFTGVATKAYVYVVDNYKTMTPISKSAIKDITVVGDAWTDWSTEQPEAGTYVPGKLQSRKEYKYRTKSTTTSTATTMSGWVQDGYTKSKVSNGTDKYVKSWPAGFYTGNSLYKKYNITPTKAVNNATTIVELGSETNAGYIYWHWCRGGTAGATNRTIQPTKQSTYTTFHAFESTSNIANKASDGSYKATNAACKDSYWWIKTRVDVKSRAWTKYNKVYNYYKISDWSNWVTALPTTRYGDYQERTVYRYVPLENINDDASTPTAYHHVVDETIDKSYAGKEICLYIYKVDEASDYSNEYIGQTTVDANGHFHFDAYLREAPTTETGDFTVAVGLAGSTSLIYLDPIKAPKKIYNVEFYDEVIGDDGQLKLKKIGETQRVEEGGNAIVPDSSLLASRDDATFTNWSESNTNITSDKKIYANYKTNEYTVVFVDWEARSVNIKKFKHGDALIAPEFEETEEGVSVVWDKIAQGVSAVTQDMVVCTEYSAEKYNVVFYNFDGDEVVSEKDVEYGTPVDAPEELGENTEILGWIDMETEEEIDGYITDKNQKLFPIFTYNETCDQPTANIETGEYSETQYVTLSTETEDAVIYYTLDGSNPAEKGKLYTGPIEIKNYAIIKAIASCIGMNDSSVLEEYYVINSENKTSDYLQASELPSYVFENIDKYNVQLYDGYKFKNVVRTSNANEYNRYIADGWIVDETSNTSWTDWQDEEIAYDSTKNGFEVETQEAEYTVQGKGYRYSRFKYFMDDEAIYSNTDDSGFVGEWEYVEVPQASAYKMVGLDPARFKDPNGEIWYNRTEINMPITMTKTQYRSRYTVATLHKWDSEVSLTLSPDETREYKKIELYTYDAENHYIVNINCVANGEMIDAGQTYIVTERDKISNSFLEFYGYTFDKLYKDAELTQAWNFDTDIVTENTTLYASYKPIKFEVKFTYKDGELIETQMVDYKSAAISPESFPLPDDHIFLGWDSDEYLSVEKDLVIKARYLPESEYSTVSFIKETENLVEGSQLKFDVETSIPNKELIWSVDDNSIAYVEDGVVYGVSAGTAVVTATVEDSGETASCTVNVLADPSSKLTFSNNSTLVFDELGYIRNLGAGCDYLNAIKEFSNDPTKLSFTNMDGEIVDEPSSVGTGYAINLDTGNGIDSAIFVVTGDMTGDGYVNNRDVVMLNKYQVQKITPEEYQLLAVDVNGDGYVNNRDAAMLARYLVGKETLK